MTVNAFKLGSSDAPAVYFGATKVFPAGYDPLTALPWSSVYWAANPNQSLTADAAVSSWSDASGNNRPAIQATGAAQPIYRASVASLNNKPALQFDGVDDFLASANYASALAQPYTIVLVSRRTSGTAASIAGAQGTGAGTIGIGFSASKRSIAFGTLVSTASADVDTNGHLFLAFGSGALSTMKVDGSSVIAAGSTAGTGTIPNTRIGGQASTTRPFTGYVAFLGILGRALTGGEETALHTWAQGEYAVA